MSFLFRRLDLRKKASRTVANHSCLCRSDRQSLQQNFFRFCGTAVFGIAVICAFRIMSSCLSQSTCRKCSRNNLASRDGLPAAVTLESPFPSRIRTRSSSKSCSLLNLPFPSSSLLVIINSVVVFTKELSAITQKRATLPFPHHLPSPSTLISSCVFEHLSSRIVTSAAIP